MKLIASMQHRMSNPSKQSLDRKSIFRCFNRRAPCLNASQLKRASQPATKVLQMLIVIYCDFYVTSNAICVAFGAYLRRGANVALFYLQPPTHF